MTNRKPNFLLIVADDHGYGDLGCYGASDLETPHLDRLAGQGGRWTQWYGGAPLCSASRASLLTGQLPHRVGVGSNVTTDHHASGMDPRVTSLPEALRGLGYQTRMSGKWHLGHRPGERPHERGFDDWFGFLHGCVDFYSHIYYWSMPDGAPPCHDLWHNGDEVFRNGEYITDLITDHAVDSLRRSQTDGRPFFHYVAFNAPHYPLHAPPEDLARFAHLDEPRQLMAAMLYSYDRAIGRILATLDELELAESTCVFVTSDHGPSRENRNWPDGRTEPFPGGSTGALRGEKFSLSEGGIRLPAIMRWPGVLNPGTTVGSVGWHADLFPTFVRAAGGEVNTKALDGTDLTRLLDRAAADDDARSLYWSIHGSSYWGLDEQWAVRRGRWKLIDQPPYGRPRSEDSLRLFDLVADPGEAHNLRARHPDVAADLQLAAERWRQRRDTPAAPQPGASLWASTRPA